ANVGYQNEITGYQKILADFAKNSPNPSAEPGYKRTQEALEKAKKASAARRDKVEEQLVAQQRRRLQRELAEEEEPVAKVEPLELLLGKSPDAKAASVKDSAGKAIDLNNPTEELELVSGVTRKMGGEVEALKVEIQAPGRVTPMSDSYATKRHGMGLQVG